MDAAPRRLGPAALLLAAATVLAPTCNPGPANPRPVPGSQLFMSPQSNPIAVSCDGVRVYVANTTSGTLSVLRADAGLSLIAEIPVGLDPVGLALRPRLDCSDPFEDEQVFVTNHLSDSISVVSLLSLAIVQTIQEKDAAGISTTDEPVGIAFDGPDAAYVTLDRRSQVLKLEPNVSGVWGVTARTPLVVPGQAVAADAFTAQAPRAIATAPDRVFVASFESGNQSELEIFPDDRVTENSAIPDRDVFVYDGDLELIEVLEGVGTLLQGAVVSGTTLYVTNTDARNKNNGLDALGNRMFENRLAVIDCTASCAVSGQADLDANGFGVPVPTPTAVAVSGDGATLVVSVAGSDGQPGDATDPSTPDVTIPGLVVLDATGAMLGQVSTGAIPTGVALHSNSAGVATTAFVLGSADSTVSMLDLSVPSAPVVVATLPVGTDPTLPEVRRGRILFQSARASTSGTFSCASCHPDGNTDQILWTINSNLGPGEPCGVSVACPAPRSTMTVRGLRDTLPLHWVGNLADPFPGVGVGGLEDPVAPDCDLTIDGEVGCIRHLVDASLSGVMCEPGAGCAAGPSGLPGALGATERDDLAAFLAAVAFPPSPERRPDDRLSSSGFQGVDDFFTDQGGLGGQAGRNTCASSLGCHQLPLTAGTNSELAEGKDVPSLRGLWDRHIMASDGNASLLVRLDIPPFDPVATGMNEFTTFATVFPPFFDAVYNVPPEAIWSYLSEMSVGLPALAGRQWTLDASNGTDPELDAELAQLLTDADRERLVLVAARGHKTWVYEAATGLWLPKRGAGIDTAALRALAAAPAAKPITVTAQLGETLAAGGSARQPLLRIDGIPDLPTLAAGGVDTLVGVEQRYVAADAGVLVDGEDCPGCSVVFSPGLVDITLDPVPATPGPHVLQLYNPRGFDSNELPFCVDSGC